MFHAMLVVHALLALHVGPGTVCFAGSSGCKAPSHSVVCFAQDSACTKKARVVPAIAAAHDPSPRP